MSTIVQEVEILVNANGSSQAVTVPGEIATRENLHMLLSNLQERDISVPKEPELTVSESGQITVHELPELG